jgi:hypothetical protein
VVITPTLLETIRSALAPGAGKVTAEFFKLLLHPKGSFFKLLLYPKGSFFKAHKDTQRSANSIRIVGVFLAVVI